MMRKISFNIKYFYFNFLILVLLIHFTGTAQELHVISSKNEYRQSVEKDSLQRMVEIKSRLPLIEYDLRYATKNNFTGVKLYKTGNKSYLRLPALAALINAEAELRSAGFGLKIWDAYRPYSVTRKMWDLIGDDRYVANPAKGSGHNRGLAVDITLIEIATNKEINMGTGFDSFTDSAHHSFTSLQQDVLAHRQLLKTTMEKFGFKALETEWWHYSFPNDNNYEVLDLPLKKLRK